MNRFGRVYTAFRWALLAFGILRPMLEQYPKLRGMAKEALDVVTAAEILAGVARNGQQPRERDVAHFIQQQYEFVDAEAVALGIKPRGTHS